MAPLAHFVPFDGGALYIPPPIDEANFNPSAQAFFKLPPPPPAKQTIVPAGLWEPLDFAHFILGTVPAAGAPGPAPAPAAAAPAPAPGPAAAGPPVAFYGYNGSTTVPPCASNVAWFVREAPVMISDTQARFFHDALYSLSGGAGNYRDLQPLGDRVVTLWQGVGEVPQVPGAPVNEESRYTEREVRPRDLSNRALRTAGSATNWAAAVDRSMTGAARALRDGLRERPR